MPPQRQSLLLTQNFESGSPYLPHFFRGKNKMSGDLNFDLNNLNESAGSPLMIKKKNLEQTSLKSNNYDTLKAMNASETSK